MSAPQTAIRRMLPVLAATALIPATGAAALASTDHASASPRVISIDDGSIVCRAGELTWYASPGISFTSGDTTQTINAQGSLNQCISAKYPDITSGRITYRANGKGSCPAGIQDGTGSAYIQWDNGQDSTAQGTFRANATQIGVFNARITSGLFNGGLANLNAHNTTNWGACLWGIGTGTGTYDNATITPVTVGEQLPPCSITANGRAACAKPRD